MKHHTPLPFSLHLKLNFLLLSTKYLLLSLGLTQIFIGSLIPRDIITLFLYYFDTHSHNKELLEKSGNFMNAKTIFFHNMLHIAFGLNIKLGIYRQTKNKEACC